MVKDLPAMRETWVRSLEEGMAAHSSILAWRAPMDIGASLIGIKKDFPGGPVVKDLLCEAGDTGSSLAGELRPARCRAHRPTCFDCRGHTLQLERWPLQRKIRVLQHRAARHSHMQSS